MAATSTKTNTLHPRSRGRHRARPRGQRPSRRGRAQGHDRVSRRRREVRFHLRPVRAQGRRAEQGRRRRQPAQHARGPDRGHDQSQRLGSARADHRLASAACPSARDEELRIHSDSTGVSAPVLLVMGLEMNGPAISFDAGAPRRRRTRRRPQPGLAVDVPSAAGPPGSPGPPSTVRLSRAAPPPDRRACPRTPAEHRRLLATPAQKEPATHARSGTDTGSRSLPAPRTGASTRPTARAGDG